MRSSGGIAVLLFLLGAPAFPDASRPAAGGRLSILLETSPAVRMDFVFVRPGRFTRGEGTERHGVRLTRGYWIQTTEVTQTQWKILMGNNPSHYVGPDRPVDTVSWKQAGECAERLTRRLHRLKASLPTEAEWEYACRAGSSTTWCFGDDEARLSEYAWYGNGPNDVGSFPVAQKKPNAWGLYDMHGNVLEWCLDWRAPYSGDAADPAGPPQGTKRIIRGGGWWGAAPLTASGNRWAYPEDMAAQMNGFRLVLH